MKRMPGRTALAVAVIALWFVALLWLILSVSQIAVVRPVPDGNPGGGGMLALIPPGFGNRRTDAFGNRHVLVGARGLVVFRRPPRRYVGRHRRR